MNTESYPVLISISNKAPSKGSVEVHAWSSAERTKRALKGLFIVWGIGLVTLPIPLIHLFVPLICLFLGPFVASLMYAQKSVVLGGKGICPNCGKDFEIVKCADNWPLKDICTECHRHVSIKKEK